MKVFKKKRFLKMIKIGRVVTDDIFDITLVGFDDTYGYMRICGHFDITINEHRKGIFVPLIR